MGISLPFLLPAILKMIREFWSEAREFWSEARLDPGFSRFLNQYFHHCTKLYCIVCYEMVIKVLVTIVIFSLIGKEEAFVSLLL